MSEPNRILIVDDQIEMGRTLADGLTDRGYVAEAVSSSREALERVAGDDIDLVVTDLRMPHVDGLQILEASLRAAPDRPVIIMTAYSAVDTAIAAIRMGAYHYLTKPFKLDELSLFVARALADAQLRRETARMRRQLEEGSGISRLVGDSAAMQALREKIRQFADASVPVLILGETGTGKSAVARAIHVASARALEPFISINCAAIPENLLESELFGHVRGAFSGATTNRPGLFAQARGGTLFLDEIAELPPALQAKLLHVLESASVRPVGADVEVPVDVRLLAATNQVVDKAVQAGTLRQDLVYRLDVLSLTVPPLRARLEDLPALVNHFLAQSLAQYPAARPRRFSDEAMAALARFPWPGNIRELSHLVHSTVLLSPSETVTLAELPARLGGQQSDGFTFGGDVLPIRELQRRYAVWAVGQLAGNRTQAANRLGVDIKTLRSWLEEAPARAETHDP